MASTLSLIKRAAALATSGLVGLRQVPDETCSSHNQGFVGYDDLVKAKGVLDLIVELPSFQEDLGRYSASLELCSSILARSIQRKRQVLEAAKTLLGEQSSRNLLLLPETPSTDKTVDVGSGCEGAIAGVKPTPGSSTTSISTLPTAWEPDDSLSFDSIVGNSTAKRALFEHVVLPLKLSEAARNSLFGGVRSPGNNVILHGPPGTGKTTIAQAASQEAGAAFYSVTPSSILSKYQGESERVLHQLFNDAKKNSPSIIFLDELDALAPSRDAQDDVQSRRLLAELLLQTSQIRPKDCVVVVAATNRIDDIDIALLRRFHSRVFVGPPNHKERVDMLASFMDGIEHHLDEKLMSRLANRISGWSGSDIKSLCREACMGPIRSLYEQEGELEKMVMQHGEAPVTLRPVCMSDCESAYSSLMGGSATLYNDQVSATMCDDEPTGDNLNGVLLHGRGEERDDGEGRRGDDHAGEREDQACVEREPQEELFDELVADIQ